MAYWLGLGVTPEGEETTQPCPAKGRVSYLLFAPLDTDRGALNQAADARSSAEVPFNLKGPHAAVSKGQAAGSAGQAALGVTSMV